jgi:hypothetical protein
MKTFTGEIAVGGPRVHSAVLLYHTHSGPMHSIPATVSYDEDTQISTITADVSAARRGVWHLRLRPAAGRCCTRDLLVFIEGCPPTVLPGEYDSTATPAPIPSCDPEDEQP